MGSEQILRLQMALHSCKMASGHHLAAKEAVLMESLRRMSSGAHVPRSVLASCR